MQVEKCGASWQKDYTEGKNRHDCSARKGFHKDNFKRVKQKQNGRKLSSSDCLYLNPQYQGSGFGFSVSSLAQQSFAEEIRNDEMKPQLIDCVALTSIPVCGCSPLVHIFSPFIKSICSAIIIQPHAQLGKGVQNTDAAPARGATGKILHYTLRRFLSSLH